MTFIIAEIGNTFCSRQGIKDNNIGSVGHEDFGDLIKIMPKSEIYALLGIKYNDMLPEIIVIPSIEENFAIDLHKIECSTMMDLVKFDPDLLIFDGSAFYDKQEFNLFTSSFRKTLIFDVTKALNGKTVISVDYCDDKLSSLSEGVVNLFYRSDYDSFDDKKLKEIIPIAQDIYCISVFRLIRNIMNEEADKFTKPNALQRRIMEIFELPDQSILIAGQNDKIAKMESQLEKYKSLAKNLAQINASLNDTTLH